MLKMDKGNKNDGNFHIYIYTGELKENKTEATCCG